MLDILFLSLSGSKLKAPEILGHTSICYSYHYIENMSKLPTVLFVLLRLLLVTPSPSPKLAKPLASGSLDLNAGCYSPKRIKNKKLNHSLVIFFSFSGGTALEHRRSMDSRAYIERRSSSLRIGGCVCQQVVDAMYPRTQEAIIGSTL